MENRSRKRLVLDNQLPVDKRACNLTESVPGTSNSSVQTQISEFPDCETETTSSASQGGEVEKEDSMDGGSYDSDDNDIENDTEDSPIEKSFRDHYRRRMYEDQGKLGRISSSLREGSGPDSQLVALTELCDVLSFCSEDSMPSVESLCPALVSFSRQESNPDIMLLAIRAITYLCDVSPRWSGYLVRNEVVPALCLRLMAIEYMDVAEQCLQALEKISRDHPVPCLDAGAIMAILNYIDFFCTSIQRVAVSAVANICKKLPSDRSSSFMQAVPVLCNLLQHDDQKLVENAALCLTRIVERVGRSSQMLEELCKYGLIHHATQLISSNSRTNANQPIYSGLIGMLCTLASGSVSAARTLLELNISSTLKHVLSSYELTHGMPYSVVGDGNCNQVHEFLRLLNEILPPMARNNDTSATPEKEKILVDHPALLLQLGVDILPVLIQVVNSGANLHICYCSLSVINKIVYYSKSDMLIELLKDSNISSFLAGVFVRKDHHVLMLVLKIVEDVLQKAPEVFLNSFVKEGVIYAIDALLSPEKGLKFEDTISHPSSASNQKSAAKDVLRCLCYAFDIKRAPSTNIGTCKLEQDCVCTLAKHIKGTYFNIEPQKSNIGLTETVQQLRNHCALLTNEVRMSMNNDLCAQHEEVLSHILDEIMTVLNGGEYMSTFEFIESGVIQSLVAYLSNGHNLKERVDGSSPDFRILLKRLGLFARCSLSANRNWEGMPFAVLVNKSQRALSSLEDFSVILSHASKPRGAYATVPVGRSTYGPCLKVCFVREEDEVSLCDYNMDVVTVEPFSSLEKIERFLWPKVSSGRTENLNFLQPLEQPEDLSHQVPADVNSPQQECQNIIETDAPSSGPEPMLVDKDISSPTTHEGLVNTIQTISGEVSVREDVKSLLDADIKPLVDANLKDSDNATHVTFAGKELEGGSTSNGDASAKLGFYFEGRQINRAFTLYQAIVQQRMKEEHDIVVGPRFWSEVYRITYRRAARPKHLNAQKLCVSQTACACCNAGKFWCKAPLISSMLVPELPSDLEKSDPTYEVLFLLNMLAGVNNFAFHLISEERRYAFSKGESQDVNVLGATVSAVPETEFVNDKLTEKLEQQMRDPLVGSVGSMPAWCSQLMGSCPYLFGIEARSKYFRLVTFGLPRDLSLSRLQSANGNLVVPNDRQLSLRGLPKKKFQVCRSRILESAAKMMDLYASHKAVLEVEYSEEVGSGLGPTMEFYTLVGHEFQKFGLGMWRGDYSNSVSGEDLMVVDSGLLVAPLGLFPRPFSTTSSSSIGIEFSKVIKMFVLLGQVVAKAIQDGRVLDIPLSDAFYKLILDKELSIYDIPSIDPELGRALLEFQALIDRKKGSESVSGRAFVSDLCFQNTKIEELCLDFSLPGYSDYVISSGGEHRMVNLSNLEEYVLFVLDATVNSGISKQVEAFKSGFNQVFPIRNLQVFKEGELERLLCGERNAWTFDELLEHVKCDHGYTSSSSPIVNLLEIIQEFGRDQQGAFLQFVTGAPRLPPGGLAALNPTLTIVRKHCDGCVDGDLPSVMTCANYLKLPPYSSKEIMRERLLYAITEGQGSFHLS